MRIINRNGGNCEGVSTLGESHPISGRQRVVSSICVKLSNRCSDREVAHVNCARGWAFRGATIVNLAIQGICDRGVHYEQDRVQGVIVSEL